MASDLIHIPPELGARSLSDREIVLPYNEILAAIEYLKGSDCVVIAWEGWVSYVDGTMGHSRQHMGTDSVPRQKDESPKNYVLRASEIAMMTIRAAQQAWDEQPEHSGATLCFCLSIECQNL